MRESKKCQSNFCLLSKQKLKKKCFHCTNNYFVFFKWECKTADLSFYDYQSTYTVSCEGYDYIEDPFVLEGSCAV